MSLSQEMITGKNMFEWQKFIKTGNYSGNKVRPQILASWERCFNLEINPYSTRRNVSLAKDQLENTLRRNNGLINIARPLTADLFKITKDAGFVIALTDALGYILELFAADNHPLTGFASANFFPGACWNENAVGTNAAGTALVTKEPLQVNGAEHYCSKYHSLTSSAAPIFASDGVLLGVLTIAGVLTVPHLHTLGMVTAGAAAIMAQMSLLDKNREIETLRRSAIAKKTASIKGASAEKDNVWQFHDIVGNSEGMIEAGRVANLAASTTANVLLYGESGTGKEIFAQAIHNKSDRKDGSFVAVNCGAIPKELIASELFGYEDGSFTGARKGGKAGKFEIASGGTLFLDEIGDMPLEQQVALLRVLQERKITRVGGHKEIAIDIRIICATNKSLPEQIKEGKFRQDLYYRLNVVSITIPALRERGRDILLLFNYFLEKLNPLPKRSFILDTKASACLLEYPWPGNVRELQNVVERIISLTQGSVISLEHLPPEIRSYQMGKVLPEIMPPEETLFSLSEGRTQFRQMRAETEKREILFWLKTSNGNVSFTAKKVGISRNTLYRKMKIYGIEN